MTFADRARDARSELGRLRCVEPDDSAQVQVARFRISCLDLGAALEEGGLEAVALVERLAKRWVAREVAADEANVRAKLTDSSTPWRRPPLAYRVLCAVLSRGARWRHWRLRRSEVKR